GVKTHRGLEVGRPVPADGDVGQLHPELEQPVGQPRPVLVLDPAGENLGSGDDDACTRAHRTGAYAIGDGCRGTRPRSLAMSAISPDAERPSGVARRPWRSPAPARLRPPSWPRPAGRRPCPAEPGPRGSDPHAR